MNGSRGRIRRACVHATLMVVAVMFILVITACSTTDSANESTSVAVPDALVLIAGVHAGMPAADVPVELRDTVLAAVDAQAPVTVVANDGTPEVVFHAADYTIDRDNTQAHDNSVNAVVTAMLDAVRQATADADGNNLGASLAVARDQLSADGATAGAILVIDNGLSDQGYPALTTPGFLDEDSSEQIVQFAQDHDEMLALTPGTAVYLVGLGYTASPQPDLTPTQRDILTRTWETYLRRAGATVTIISVPRTGDGPNTSYTTTLVDPGTYDQLDITGSSDTVTAELGADVLFDSDSATLRDDAATSQALEQAATFLAVTPGAVTITGHTDAIGDADSNLTLSTARASAIRDWLVQQGGVDPDRVTIIGKGETDPLVPDAITPEELQQNRRVEISVKSD